MKGPGTIISVVHVLVQVLFQMNSNQYIESWGIDKYSVDSISSAPCKDSWHIKAMYGLRYTSWTTLLALVCVYQIEIDVPHLLLL